MLNQWGRCAGVLLLVTVSFFGMGCGQKIMAQFYYSQAGEAHNKGNYPKAIELYQKYLSISPNDPEVNYNMGVAYLDSGDKGKAQEQVKKLAALGETAMSGQLAKMVVTELYPDEGINVNSKR